MRFDPTVAGSIKSAPLQCSARIPKAGLQGLAVGVRRLDRLGATVCIQPEQLGGSVIETGDNIELDLPLPQNKMYRPRTLSFVGSIIRTSHGVAGKLWLVVRFHSLHFRGAAAVRPGEEAASRGGQTREPSLTGRDGAEDSFPQGNGK